MLAKILTAATVLVLLIPSAASAEKDIKVCGQSRISPDKTYLDCTNLKNNFQLKALEKMTKLETLVINNGRAPVLDAKGMGYIAEHVGDTLEKLDVGGMRNLPSEALAPLAEKAKKLKILVLRNTAITDDALKHVGKITTLKDLTISYVDIKGPGLAHLSGLKDLTTLRLAKTDIGDEHLKPLAGLEKLEYLDVSKTNVTDKGVEWLQERLPDLRISK